VAVGNKDVAVESNGGLGRLIEGVETGTSHTGLPECEQELAILVEFENCWPLPSFMPLSATHRLPSWSTVICGADEEPVAEFLEELAGGVEFEDGVERGAGAVSALRARDATAIESPDVAIQTGGDPGRGAPLSSVGSGPTHAGAIGTGRSLGAPRGDTEAMVRKQGKTERRDG